MNRVLGIIFSIGVIAIMAFAVLNWGNYTSLCFTEEDVVEEDIEVMDIGDSGKDIIPTDSITLESVEIVDKDNATIPLEQADSLNN